jgi:hypothetical protein
VFRSMVCPLRRSGGFSDRTKLRPTLSFYGAFEAILKMSE